MQTIKYFLRPAWRLVANTLNFLWDARLNVTSPVKESGKEIFRIYDYGKVTRMRKRTFESKEPETLAWINSFDDEDNLIDIGANLGIYSLYAAYKGFNVIAIEPDALNYALLNLNIRVNNFGEKITPYCIAMHDVNKFSKFNISSYEWGGALNSFDNTKDYRSNQYQPIHSQGVFGLSLDSFLESLEIQPRHLKIDVDGNEYLILKGAIKTLKNQSLKSILIELGEDLDSYKESISIIEQSGFKLIEKTNSIIGNSRFSKIYNHIFSR